MDKRFQDVIKTMEELISKSGQVQKQIEEKFIKVKDFQTELDGKMDSVNSEVKQAMDRAKYLSESLHNEYKSKIDEFIKVIEGKSKEILEIYSELENMRKMKQEYKTELNKIAEDHRLVIEELKKSQSEAFNASLIGKIGKKINRFMEGGKNK